MSNSNALQRQEYIRSLLETHQNVSAKELASRLDVSIWTIRRDLNSLEEHGVLRRFYGGCHSSRDTDHGYPPQECDSFRAAAGENLEAKRCIGQATSRLLHSCERVALAGGTTTLEVAKALKLIRFKGEIVTNALDIALELSEEPDIHIICTGGDVLPRYRTLAGRVTERMLKLYYFDVAVVGVSGISVRHGITVNSQVDATALELMMDHSSQTIVVADHTKFGRVSFASLDRADLINTIATDEPPPAEYNQYLQSMKIKLVIADHAA